MAAKLTRYIALLLVFSVLLIWLPSWYSTVFAVASGWLLVASLPTHSWFWAKEAAQQRSWLSHLLCGSGSLVIALLLYYPSPEAWWMPDDPAILRHVLEHPLFDNFLYSDTWRQFSAANLTPLVLLSFGFDFSWFGLDTSGYYWHQLTVILAILVSAYILLVRWLPPIMALAILIAFTAALPLATMSHELMTRHYLEGLLLTLWALAAFLRSLKKKRWHLAWLAAAFYLLACTAKEVYVPFLLLPLWLLVGPGWKQRLAYVTPFVIAAVSYTAWRFYMLKPSNVLSGYGSLHQASPASLGDIGQKLLVGLGWQNEVLLFFIASTSLLAIIYMIKQGNRWHLAALLMVTATILLPLIPIRQVLSARHLLLLVGLLITLSGVGLALLTRGPSFFAKVLPLPLMLLWVGLSLDALANSGAWIQRDHLTRFRVEGQFILQGDADKTLVTPSAPSWFYANLTWLREHFLQQGAAPAVCYQPCLCSEKQLQNTVSYTKESLTPAPEHLAHCKEQNAAISIQVVYDSKKGVIHWQLGPYKTGKWFYLLAPDSAPTALPASGYTPIYIAKKIELRIIYQAAEGWFTQSEPLFINPEKIAANGKVEVHWQRRDAGM